VQKTKLLYVTTKRSDQNNQTFDSDFYAISTDSSCFIQ